MEEQTKYTFDINGDYKTQFETYVRKKLNRSQTLMWKRWENVQNRNNSKNYPICYYTKSFRTHIPTRCR
ncbi:hypothetical protein WAZ07_11810 [Bacillus sp. FJAT-51639]|uniref:Uncharacterized protein n=1 Tax=Bacillus bruguierae TaxID=3127667 RepID=A0ABU8FH28_9BACI